MGEFQNQNNKSQEKKNLNDDGIEVMEKVDIDALVDRCLQQLKDSQDANHNASNSCTGFNCYQQVFVGIAGGPGSGKSTIAEQVRDAINKRNPNGDASRHECVVIPMDGYHMSRNELKKKAEAGEYFKTDQLTGDGEPVRKQFSYEDLMARRGAAFTFNPKAFVRDLKEIKNAGEGCFPTYSREKHDPVPNGVSVTQDNKIILVEGLYLLCFDDPEWKPLDDLWDDKWFIHVSLPETKKRLVHRHLKTWNEDKTQRWGGDDEAAAARKAESNDMPNAECILKNSKSNANLIISNEDIPEDDTNNADVEAAV